MNLREFLSWIMWGTRPASKQPSPEPAMPPNQAALISTQPIESSTQRFERVMQQRAAQNNARWLRAIIAGTAHKNSNGTSRQKAIQDLVPLEPLDLMRDSGNRHSPNAVKITDMSGRQVGFVPEWLARDISAALDSNGYAECIVEDLFITSSEKWGVNVGIAWYARASPPNEFRRVTERRSDVDEWFWARLSSRTTNVEQEALQRLTENERLFLVPNGVLQEASILRVCNSQQEAIGTLTRHQAVRVLEGMRAGQQYIAEFIKVRERRDGGGLQPVIAILRMKGSVEH